MSSWQFKTFKQTEVIVNINSVARVGVTLEIGSTDDTVTFNAEPPMLRTRTPHEHARLAGTASRAPFV